MHQVDNMMGNVVENVGDILSHHTFHVSVTSRTYRGIQLTVKATPLSSYIDYSTLVREQQVRSKKSFSSS